MLNYVKNKVKSHFWSERPESLNIELTSICDAKCIHCPRQEMERKMKPMDMDLFKKIIDEAAELKVPTICPNGYGELLTLKNLPDYLGYIRSKKHKFFIAINTNGHQFTEEKRKMFFDYKVDYMNVCLDGATHETMALIREKLNPEKIENNLLALFEERKNLGVSYPKVRLGYIKIPQNKHEEQDFLKKWRGVADMVGLDGYSNRLDSLKDKIGEIEYDLRDTCILPFNTLNIWSDGNCVICCNDWNEELVVGNIVTERLIDIWHGEPLKKIRSAHFKGCGKDIDVCSKCNYWQLKQPGQTLWI